MNVYSLTETWLKPDILSSEYFDYNYVVFRKDRDEPNPSLIRGGGILIAVSTRFSCDDIQMDNT